MQIESELCFSTEPKDPGWLVQVCSIRVGTEAERRGFKRLPHACVAYTHKHTFTY